MDNNKVDQLLRLALIESDKKHTKDLEKDISLILQCVERITEIEGVDVVDELREINVVREDIQTNDSQYRDHILSQAADIYKDYIKTKKIL